MVRSTQEMTLDKGTESSPGRQTSVARCWWEGRHYGRSLWKFCSGCVCLFSEKMRQSHQLKARMKQVP